MAQLTLEFLTGQYCLLSTLIMLMLLLVACVVAYYVNAAVRHYLVVRDIGQVVDKLPGPAGTHWLYGNLKLFPGFNQEMLNWLQDQVREFPYISRFWFGPLQPTVMVTHPDTIKVILRSTEPKQMIGGAAYALFKPWLGDGLLLSSGGKYTRNRRLLTPAFHFDVLKSYIEVYNQSAEELLDKLIWDLDKPNDSVEITEHITMCTLDIIMRCAMSYNNMAQGTNHPYADSVLNASRLISSRAMKPHLYVDALYYLTHEGKEFKRELRHLHGVSEDIIARRKLDMAGQGEFMTMKHPDFLDLLLLSRDDEGNGLTDLEIRDEVDTFMFGGHDTTSSAISWILYSLAANLNHQERCREELQQIIVHNTGRHYIHWDDLQSDGMSYLTKCIKEAIRLHCPVHWIGREVQQPFQLHGVTLKPHTLVDISIYCLHHNPLVWGEDHNEFKPERFNSDVIEKMDAFAFIPFSAGPRNCIGQNFAMNEMKVIIARVLMKYELRVDESHNVRHLPEVVMRAETGIKLFCRPIR